MAWTTPGTATAGNVLTASFWNEQVRDNMVELAPLSAAWTSYVPVLTAASVNPNIGSTGTRVGYYLKIGKTVLWQFQIVPGGTGIAAGTGEYYVTIPFAPRFVVFQSIGSGWGYGTQFYTLSCDPSPGSSRIRMINTAVAAVGSTNQPVSAGAVFVASGMYEIS